MRIPVLLFLCVFIVSGCSYLLGAPPISKPRLSYKPEPIDTPLEPTEIKVVGEDPSGTEAEEDTKKTASRFVLDKSAPASFSDYRQWRRENDPGGQVYAEFKAWEAALKEQQLKQQKTEK